MKLQIKLLLAAAAAGLCMIIRRPGGCLLVVCVFSAGLLTENIIAQYRMNRRLNSLIEYTTKVQDDLSLKAPEYSSEGLEGILQSEIYKVVALLREQYSGEKKQKEYMAEMLSDISHQIRTPLTAMQLMTELLEKPGVSEEARIEYAGKIDSQIARITWLIRNLLALSQFEAGMLKMNRVPIHLPELAEELEESLGIMAELGGVSLILDVPDYLISADRHWLREALMNIVKNGIEHTKEGGIVRLEAQQNNIVTELTVTDNGSGISEKDLPHIFERFYRAENASAQSVGIGLALAKQIIHAHGGTVEVSGRKGEGTAFSIKLYRMG